MPIETKLTCSSNTTQFNYTPWCIRHGFYDKIDTLLFCIILLKTLENLFLNHEKNIKSIFQLCAYWTIILGPRFLLRSKLIICLSWLKNIKLMWQTVWFFSNSYEIIAVLQNPFLSNHRLTVFQNMWN